MCVKFRVQKHWLSAKGKLSWTHFWIPYIFGQPNPKPLQLKKILFLLDIGFDSRTRTQSRRPNGTKRIRFKNRKRGSATRGCPTAPSAPYPHETFSFLPHDGMGYNLLELSISWLLICPSSIHLLAWRRQWLIHFLKSWQPEPFPHKACKLFKTIKVWTFIFLHHLKRGIFDIYFIFFNILQSILLKWLPVISNMRS